jgi:hypothetical protein
LPTAIVTGDLAVGQLLHEVALAQSPVEEQVLGQKHRDDHTRTIGHETGLRQLPHGGIDDRKSRLSCAPALKVPGNTGPLYSPMLRVELDFQHFRKMPENAEIEFAPNKLTDELLGAFSRGGRQTRCPLSTFCDEFANGEQSEAKILGKARREFLAKQISTVPIPCQPVIQKALHPRARRLLTRFEHLAFRNQSPCFQTGQRK